jgi:hypothetical protein
MLTSFLLPEAVTPSPELRGQPFQELKSLGSNGMARDSSHPKLSLSSLQGMNLAENKWKAIADARYIPPPSASGTEADDVLP